MFCNWNSTYYTMPKTKSKENGEGRGTTGDDDCIIIGGTEKQKNNRANENFVCKQLNKRPWGGEFFFRLRMM